MYRYTRKSLFQGHENMVNVAFRGVDDFLKGIDFLKEIDLEKNHKELCAYCKKLENEKKKIKIYYFVYAGFQFVFLYIKSSFVYPKVVRQYQKRKLELTTLDFWMKKYGE